ncbi:MAG TPA: alpha/beta fold hydrolase [Casimicrobiaceae bacterium]|nr:alpha/beta fold hydrolase [Casimicrobiaceae bacterium]
MNDSKRLVRLAAAIACAALSGVLWAADYPAPVEGNWTARDFRFHTGEVMAQMAIHYRTIGAATGEPVLLLHGTASSSASMLTPAFAGQLFGPGQPLDASRYYIILPDAVGHGGSSKPSDGLRMKFPQYDYTDMVNADYRLLTEHLNIKHVRLVMGNSMGGMESWLFAENYPGYMDVAVPMACLPIEMGSRNWMLRRLIIDSIRNDPSWMGGQYTLQPKSAHFASVFFGIATSGGNQAYYKAAPTREKADQLLDQRLAAPFTADANDVLYQWSSSGDFNPSADIGKVTATVLAINAADDERNPAELGILERDIRRIPNGKAVLIPAGPDTAGHGTTANARFYQQQLREVLQTAPRI